MTMRIRDTRRLGLVEVEIDDSGKVLLGVNPPGKPRSEVIMAPDDARGLARGLLEAADQAELPPAPPAYPQPGELRAAGLPDV